MNETAVVNITNTQRGVDASGDSHWAGSAFNGREWQLELGLLRWLGREWQLAVGLLSVMWTRVATRIGLAQVAWT
jgi:hypothetical protein